MKRRDLLAAAGAASLDTLAAPSLSRAQNARVLRFVKQAIVKAPFPVFWGVQKT